MKLFSVCLLLFVALLPIFPSSSAAEPCSSYTEIFSVGEKDDFALPVEHGSPTPDYQAVLNVKWPQWTTLEFDSYLIDYARVHSFTGWRGPVCGATLTVRLAATGSSAVNNDSVRLSWIGSRDPQQAFRYWTTIRNVVGHWQYGDVVTITLDLENLPAYVSFPTNILRDLSDGHLEFMVEDDTAVDYAELCVTPCHLQVPVVTATWSGVKARHGDLR